MIESIIELLNLPDLGSYSSAILFGLLSDDIFEPAGLAQKLVILCHEFIDSGRFDGHFDPFELIFKLFYFDILIPSNLLKSNALFLCAITSTYFLIDVLDSDCPYRALLMLNTIALRDR